MLENSFAKIYTKFKMSLYSKVFNQDIDVEDSLSAIEVLCVELIYSMGKPTINEFAKFAQLSAPNAAYKVNSLVKKGYVNKVQSTTDKREYHLEVTEKYEKTYGVTYDYIGTVMKRIRERFSPEEVEEFEEILGVIDDELMPEVKLDEEEKEAKPKAAGEKPKTDAESVSAAESESETKAEMKLESEAEIEPETEYEAEPAETK